MVDKRIRKVKERKKELPRRPKTSKVKDKGTKKEKKVKIKVPIEMPEDRIVKACKSLKVQPLVFENGKLRRK